MVIIIDRKLSRREVGEGLKLLVGGGAVGAALRPGEGCGGEEELHGGV